MATTPSLRTAVGNLCLGSAPDSWGVWFPEDEHQVSHTRFLDELAAAGYKWLELGPYGYLPTDPQQLKGELDARGLQVSGGTVFGALHRPEAWEELLAHVRQVATLTAAAGAHHLVLIPPMYRDEKTGAFTESPELTTEQWAASAAPPTGSAGSSSTSTTYGSSSTRTQTATSRPSPRSSACSTNPIPATPTSAWTPGTWPTAAATTST